MKGIALISGGLDSLLAAYVIKSQGIEVIGINFSSSFFDTRRKAENVGKNLRIPIIYRDISLPLLEIIRKPKYGFGKNLNPCIDCHILMIKEALKVKEEVNAAFIITGEVLGERPKSQNRKALELVEKESGAEGYILRPLSAKLLKPSEPERLGWVNRDKLFKLHGKGRKAQFYLAEKYKLESYATPAGGCLLTDPKFSAKLKHLLSLSYPQLKDIELLKIGRHLKLNDRVKVVVARNASENEAILRLRRPQDKVLQVKSREGAKVLLQSFTPTELKEEYIIKAAQIAIHYSKARESKDRVEIELRNSSFSSFMLYPSKDIATLIKDSFI
jgi:tRNA U34 2-thiouridine synthase MnmA/TrmU